jgi:hypothetical protein
MSESVGYNPAWTVSTCPPDSGLNSGFPDRTFSTGRDGFDPLQDLLRFLFVPRTRFVNVLLLDDSSADSCPFCFSIIQHHPMSGTEMRFIVLERGRRLRKSHVMDPGRKDVRKNDVSAPFVYRAHSIKKSIDLPQPLPAAADQRVESILISQILTCPSSPARTIRFALGCQSTPRSAPPGWGSVISRSPLSMFHTAPWPS